ncbi:MAG: DedA family protein [Actinomycetota bacterium]|nr:DedA family protein [Actinomycetota bacterium]
MDILQAILNLFIRYGYFFLFFATALENIPVVGMFLPGEVIVVAAGFFAASGKFDVAAVILIAALGAFLGTICSYALGFWGGRSFLEMLATKLRVDGDRLNSADRYFTTHGHITVFVGRYLSGIKAFIPALAGAHRMRFGTFLLFASLAIVTWTVLATGLGYFFGANWPLLMKIIRTAGWLILLLAALIIGLIWYRRRGR